MSAYRGIRFSWAALPIAPLPVGLIVGRLLTPANPPFSWSVFGILAALVLAFAYGGTVALALCVWLIGKWRPLNLALCTLLGTVLALGAYLPMLWMTWASSGPDSGPPLDTFSSYLLRSWNDPIGALFIGCGATTALIYGLIARRLTPPQT